MRVAAGAALTLMAACLSSAWAQSSSAAGGIYTCVDAQGRRFTSDRPIPQCLDREQTVHNVDGSVRRTVGPSLTAEERAAHEEAQRKRLVQETARRDAVRQDRNLLMRFPDAAAHQRARDVALQPVLEAQRINRLRNKELRAEEAKLKSELEFYQGRTPPRELTLRLDANRNAQRAQETVAASQQTELDRLNQRYDEELRHLEALWAGAPLGHRVSVGAASRNATAH